MLCVQVEGEATHRAIVIANQVKCIFMDKWLIICSASIHIRHMQNRGAPTYIAMCDHLLGPFSVTTFLLITCV